MLGLRLRIVTTAFPVRKETPSNDHQIRARDHSFE
jgi:hypothetical protein